MKIPTNCKLEKVAAKDKSRPNINGICIDGTGDAPVAIATNGRILAVVPIELGADDDLTGDLETGVRLLPAAVLPAARKGCRGDAVIRLNGGAELIDGTSFPTQSEDRYPNWRVVDRQHQEGERGILSFSPHLLLALAEGIGIEKGNGVEVEVALEGGAIDASRPLIVRNKANGAHGVLMPIRQS